MSGLNEAHKQAGSRGTRKAAIGTMHAVDFETMTGSWTVRHRCRGKTARPYCLTHQQAFAGVPELLAHTRAGGDHVTAWVCFHVGTTEEGGRLHGLEQVEA